MQKEKTAMQMLIEAMQKYHDTIDDTINFALHVQKNEIWLRIQQAKRFLQKEQEQIETAFDEGYGRGRNIFFNEDEPENGSEYYQSKYGGEE